MSIRIYFITFLFLAFVANVSAQEDELSVIQGTRGPQSEKFEELNKELDFDQTKNVWRLKEKEKEEKEEVERDNADYEPKNYDQSPGFSFNGSLANFLAYAMIALLIGVIIYLIFSNVKVEKKIDAQAGVIDIEDIEEVDALDGFKKAIIISDYRSAIRMQFIKVLQMLQEGNHIHWRPEKTNRDYLRELSGSKFKSSFRDLSGIYELVWYGNTSIDKDIFEQLNPSFDKFINRGNEQ